MQISIIHVGRFSVAIRFDGLGFSACSTCIELRLLAFDSLMEGEVLVTEESDSELIERIEVLPHIGVTIAVTNIIGDPDYIICTPLPYCPNCWCKRSEQRKNIFEYSSKSICNLQVLEKDSFREVDSRQFVKNMKHYIGSVGVMGSPVTQIGSPAGMSYLNSMQLLSDDYRNVDVAGGKGKDLFNIMASCIGEGIERYALTGVLTDVQPVSAHSSLPRLAVDPISEWGFPVIDSNPSISSYDGSMPIQWAECDELTNGKAFLIPADMIFAPPQYVRESCNITVGSTNGTASGATIRDATIQAILEIVERDAFWFYMRTKNHPVRIQEDNLPREVIELMLRHQGIRYIFELLPNPMGIPVVQVLANDSTSGKLIQARGTGAHINLQEAIFRAFYECGQMLTSLRTSSRVDKGSLDMRYIWYSGKAEEIFPQIFEPVSDSNYFFEEFICG